MLHELVETLRNFRRIPKSLVSLVGHSAAQGLNEAQQREPETIVKSYLSQQLSQWLQIEQTL